MKLIEGTGGSLDYVVFAENDGYMLAYKHYGFKAVGEDILAISYRLRATPDPDAAEQVSYDTPAEAFSNISFEKADSDYASVGGVVKIKFTGQAMDVLLEEIVGGYMTEKIMQHLAKPLDNENLIDGALVDLREYYDAIVNKAISLGDVEAHGGADAVYLQQLKFMKAKYGDKLTV